MRWIVIAVSLLFLGGIWDPPIFIPVTHADGSQTWTYLMSMRDVPKQDRALAAEELARKYMGGVLGHYRFCKSGWSITNSRIKQKRLIVEGKCSPP